MKGFHESRRVLLNTPGFWCLDADLQFRTKIAEAQISVVYRGYGGCPRLSPLSSKWVSTPLRCPRLFHASPLQVGVHASHKWVSTPLLASLSPLTEVES
jgi:hypothetical protein